MNQTAGSARNYLGIDLGTSEIKVLMMAEQGEVIAVSHAPLTLSQPQPGWSEQDPAQWWQGVVTACRELRERLPEQYAAIAAIGLSGQMHGATVLDADHNVLRPCILWNDSRSAPQCAALTQACPALHDIAGNLAMPGFTAPKIAWLRDHEPGVYQRIDKVLLPKDYLRFQLTGNMVSEMSDAAGTLWLDVGRRDWSDVLLSATGLTRAHMPRLVEGSAVSGMLSNAAASLLGLQSGIPVAGGAGDNAASAIGIGAIRPGDSFLSLGTSGVLFSVTDRHRPNVADAVHAFCHALPGMWHQMTVMLSAASALSWVTRLTGSASEGQLLEQVAQLSAAERAAAPVFLPYLSGERTPHNDASASGMFFGLRHQHGAAHLGYAVIDGVSLGMRDGLDALRRAGTQIDSVQLVGGGSRSALWAQLLASALEVTVRVGQDSSVGAALGAARLARLCNLGEPASWAGRIDTLCSKPPALAEYVPIEQEVLLARRRQQQFRAAYASMKPLFHAAGN